jgi:hypothetical protein
MDFFSPVVRMKNKKLKYDKKTLLILINAWNDVNSNNKIEYKKGDTIAILSNKLNEKVQPILKTTMNTSWIWIDVIKYMAAKLNKYEIISNLQEIEKKLLRPSQPRDWINNPQEWLSNYDILNVVNQYQSIPALKYKFLGVFSIDFGLKKDGICLYSTHCNINLAKLLASNKIKYIGFVTNLSKASEPGTHWTSSFFVLDPTLPSYGGYYYDSTASKMPKDLQPVFIDIKKQAEELFKKDFNIYINNKKHQYGNNACGLFSIAFQVRWVLLLRKNKKTIMKDVIDHPSFTDKKMDILRLKYFRPNILSFKLNI